jgi:hypothetical protein
MQKWTRVLPLNALKSRRFSKTLKIDFSGSTNNFAQIWKQHKLKSIDFVLSSRIFIRWHPTRLQNSKYPLKTKKVDSHRPQTISHKSGGSK